MKRWYKILLLVEIQIILLLTVFTVIKTNTLDKRLFNTNKFVHEVMVDQRKEALNTIRDMDIRLGDTEAPITIFLYTRFDCPACNDLFKESYNRLMTEFVNPGMIQLVIRYLVHPSKPNTLYATKCAHYSYKLGLFDLFIEKNVALFPEIDTLAFHNLVVDMTNDKDNFYSFIEDPQLEKNLITLATEIRDAKLLYTPTISVNDQQLIGNRRYEKLKEIIITTLGDDYCTN